MSKRLMKRRNHLNLNESGAELAARPQADWNKSCFLQRAAMLTHTITQLCRAISSQRRHVSTIGKKSVKQQYLLQMSPQYGELLPTSGWDRFVSFTCPGNMVIFGPLMAEIYWWVWGTPANFNGFRVLAALLHGTLVVSVSQTLPRWTEGATYIRQGGHHVGHWPTFLVVLVLTLPC